MKPALLIFLFWSTFPFKIDSVNAAVLSGSSSSGFGVSGAFQLETTKAESDLERLFLLRWSNFLLETGPEKRLEILEDRVRETPDDPSAASDLGYAYLAMQRFDEAAEWFWRASRSFPDHLPALEGLGFALAVTEDHHNSEKIFDVLTKKYPENSRIALNYGACLVQKGNIEEAQEIFVNELKKNPSDIKILYNYAVTEVLLNRPGVALSVLEEIFQISDDPYALGLAARIHHKKHDFSVRDQYLTRARRLDQEKSAILVMTAQRIPLFLKTP